MLLSQKLKQELGKNLKFNEPLRNWTTYRVGGRAKYFFIAKTNEEIIKAIKFAKKNKIKYFIIGAGSNLLFSDKKFNGLVIKIVNCKLKIVNCEVIVDAGILLNNLVNESIKAGLTGLEWAAGIPGTVGGAIYQNAGAFGSDLSQSINKVIILRNGKIKKLNKKDCHFKYRSSIFQKNKDIILGAELELKDGSLLESQKLIKTYINYRLDKQPRGYSAGSVFKNVDFKKVPQIAINKYPQLQSFKGSGIIPVGWLIENTGLKGKKIGGAQISEKHANFIINQEKAKAKDIIDLIKLAQKQVLKKFRIRIEKEIKIIEFDNFY